MGGSREVGVLGLYTLSSSLIVEIVKFFAKETKPLSKRIQEKLY